MNEIGPDVLQLYLVPDKEINSPSNDISTSLKVQSFNEQDAIYGVKTYDIVVANILLHPLLDLAKEIVSFARPGATVALSGIIIEQVYI